MKSNTAENSPKTGRLFRLGVIVLSMALLLTGCARPSDDHVQTMLSNIYQCKWLALDSYEKEESLPGIWSYVVRYKFNLAFVGGEGKAIQFMQGMIKTSPGETDWQKVFESPKAHAYLRDGCSLPAQKVMEQIAIQAYIQLHDKSVSNIEIPISVPIVGWSEMTPGRAGWNMDMRRDKVSPDFVRSKPVPRRVMMAKSKGR
ncbi:MAG: hypothetical protein LBM56_03500 [Burkholderiaceae bacterium]|jgi:hypothetical protein|nr:hypothetical protein [Burkholderiaceae bacterium]